MPSQSALRFGGTSPDYRESLCGRYRIPKITIAGKTRYEVWQRRADGVWCQGRVNFPTFHDASEEAGGMEFREAKA